MKEALEFMFRMFNNELTETEQVEIEKADTIRDSKKRSNNAYCACGGDIEGEEILSLDSH